MQPGVDARTAAKCPARSPLEFVNLRFLITSLGGSGEMAGFGTTRTSRSLLDMFVHWSEAVMPTSRWK
jgi:hypothetical protein